MNGVSFNAPAMGVEWYGDNVNMMSHVGCASPICVQSHFAVYWLAFAVHMLTPKNNNEETTGAIPVY